MRLLLEIIFDTFYFSAYLITGSQPVIYKIRILLTYTRLTSKLILLTGLFKLKEERIFGLRVKGFDYRTIHLLYRVIFLQNEYYFKQKRKLLSSLTVELT